MIIPLSYNLLETLTISYYFLVRPEEGVEHLTLGTTVCLVPSD